MTATAAPNACLAARHTLWPRVGTCAMHQACCRGALAAPLCLPGGAPSLAWQPSAPAHVCCACMLSLAEGYTNGELKEVLEVAINS